MCCLYVTPAPVLVDLSSVYEANKCMHGYSRVMRVRDSGLPQCLSLELDTRLRVRGWRSRCLDTTRQRHQETKGGREGAAMTVGHETFV